MREFHIIMNNKIPCFSQKCINNVDNDNKNHLSPEMLSFTRFNSIDWLYYQVYIKNKKEEDDEC